MADDRATKIFNDQIADYSLTPDEFDTDNLVSEGDSLLYENSKMKWVKALNGQVDSNKVVFFDDFLYQYLNTAWYTATSGARSTVEVIDAQGGQVLIRAGNRNGRYAELYYGQYEFSNMLYNPSMIVRLKVNNIVDSLYMIELNWTDDNNHVYLGANYGENWKLHTKASGTETIIDTGIALDTDWNIFEIRGTSSQVTAYINDTLVATSTTNIPTGTGDISIYVYATGTGGTKDVYLDAFRYVSDRG